ncbi:complement C1q tumor necrosis factor-related protein 5-like [Petromyzon marinus]|uniref:complement C1q tumor necrosis factor-related protein 5-like n=1 Tax=Petromyzon marinus TaxID=7757 RepID=UPI003F6F929D
MSRLWLLPLLLPLLGSQALAADGAAKYCPGQCCCDCEDDQGGYAKMPKSAFTAKLSMPRPASGIPIKFDVILTNSGNHYDPSTGKFTCVYPGTYYFVMHVCLFGESVYAHLKKNGQVMHKFHSAWVPGWPGVALSGGAVLSLKAGDQVWLEVTGTYNGIFVRNDIDSSFSGYLLSPE